jgi:ribosomal protein S14
MKSKLSKDIYNRLFFFVENVLLIDSYQKVSGHLKNRVVFKKKSYYTQFRNRCTLSGKSRSVISAFRISRIFFRNMALGTKLPGVKKQSW